MELLQHSIFELPPENILGTLPRFKIVVSVKDLDAIAQFAAIANEFRLDQLPDELAGNGKSGKHLQANLPVEITVCDRANAKQHRGQFLENPDSINSFPEISLEPITTHGYVEHYFVTGKNKKAYWYTRYVYQDISGKLRHHHIPKKQREAIFALWRSGASCQELCTGLGKTCKSK